MLEPNWALAANGAEIAEVSSEAVHAGSSSTNLLQLQEDALWITGDAPQYVTLSLAVSHPPLLYVGWHVWHDYLTNPSTVEIASGAALDHLKVLLICQALPGAGTQMWKLPRAIPPEHRYARFRIVSTFGPGPTYMNNIFLLEKDPGPNYNPHREQETEREGPVSNASAAEVTAPASSPYISSPASGVRRPGVSKDNHISYSQRFAPTPVVSSPSAIYTATPQRAPLSDAGLFTTLRSPFPAHREGDGGSYISGGDRTPGGAHSNSRMSQLLRDLDDDIRMLKPIKTVSPTKNLLMYVPQEPPDLQVEDDVGNDAHRFGRGDGGSGGDGEGRVGGPNKASSDAQRSGYHSRHHRHHHHHRHRGSSRHAHQNRDHSRAGAGQNGECGGAHTSPFNGTPSNPPVAPSIPMALTAWPSPSLPGSPAALFDARLGALEQAVAALNEAVQHQRDDLTMIKRVLLQQATERRKEAALRREEKQTTNAVAALSAALTPTPIKPSPTFFSPPVALLDSQLNHRSITVGFPEGALHAYVESVFEHNMRKSMKQAEAKVMQRLDKQMHEMVKVLSATVEGRLGGVQQAPVPAPSLPTQETMRPDAKGLTFDALSTAYPSAREGANKNGPSYGLSDVDSTVRSSQGHHQQHRHRDVAKARTDDGCREN